MNLARESLTIAGAGPTGALLAIFLQRRGARVTLIEARPDPANRASDSGRSINLALADRGIHALKLAGVFEQIEGALIPMRGRCVHHLDGTTALQPYGRLANEVIYSISRHRLTQVLLRAALGRPGTAAHFEHRVERLDWRARLLVARDLRSGRPASFPMQPLIAADGAGSLIRRQMAAQNLIEASESDLAHGYKELSVPAGPRGEHRLLREALHIWPRGGYMLIALPNEDGSFTATLFLPMQGPTSFAALTEAGAIDGFLAANFPDARALMPDCVGEFQRNPTGFLGTVRAAGWHHGASAALIGDAAHAIVPFHGQGMNCCFEDCAQFDACAEHHASWDALFASFYERRKPNTDAIAEMALENYLEMRARVADPNFQLQQALALELERRFPERFIPRYSMVMFHHEIPYRTALERGAVQARLLAELCRGAAALEQIDYRLAEREVQRRLEPISAAT